MSKYWERDAEIAESVYGCFVNWEERFFLCPECGDAVYEDAYLNDFFDGCPICGFQLEEE